MLLAWRATGSAHSEEWTDYTGGRDIEHFDLFVNRMTGLPVTAVDSGKQLAEVMEAQAPEVVFALCSDDDHHIANTFYDTARDFQHRHVRVACSLPDVCLRVCVGDVAVVVVAGCPDVRAHQGRQHVRRVVQRRRVRGEVGAWRRPRVAGRPQTHVLPAGHCEWRWLV